MPGKTLQADLFSYPGNDMEPIESSATHLYLVTNRNNLLDVLSSGQIKPQVLYNKYYPDLGQFIPNGIPLLLQPPGHSLVAAAVAESETLFPVVIEIKIDQLSGKALLIDNDFVVTNIDFPCNLPGVGVVVSGVIPTSCIEVVHFRNMQDLHEYKMRKFSNVPDGIVSLQLSPDMFSGSDVDLNRLRDSLAKANTILPKVKRFHFDRADSLAGSIFTLSSLMKKDGRLPLQGIIDLLDNIKNFPFRTDSKKLSSLSAKFTWISYLPGIMLSEEDSSIIEIKTRSIPRGDPVSIPDHFLFGLAIRQLAWMTPTTYTYEKFLSNIEQDIIGFRESTPDAISQVESNRVTKAFKSIRKIMMGAESIEGFNKQYPSEIYPIFTALLIFIQRKDPHFILQIIDGPNVPDASALAMAVAFSGALPGRILLPLECHPGKELASLIDLMMTDMLNSLENGLKLPIPQETFRVSVNETPTGQQSSFFIGNEPLLVRMWSKEQNERLSAKPALTTRATKSSGVKRTASQSDESRKIKTKKNGSPAPGGQEPGSGEPEAVIAESKAGPEPDYSLEDLRNTILASQLIDPQQPEYRAALEICSLAGWSDIVRTIIPLAGREFTMEYHKAKNEFRVIGFVTPQVSIFKPEEFKTRLMTIDISKMELNKSLIVAAFKKS